MNLQGYKTLKKFEIQEDEGFGTWLIIANVSDFHINHQSIIRWLEQNGYIERTEDENRGNLEI